MSTDNGLEPDIRTLVDAERAAPGAPATVKARVTARLGIAPRGGGGPVGTELRPATGSAGRASNVAAVHKTVAAIAFALGAVVGGAVVALRTPAERIVYVDRASASAPTSAQATADSSWHAAAPSGTTSPSGSAEGPKTTARSAGATPDGSLAAEQVLLDAARVALGRHDAAEALRAADRHQRRFPSGKLAEEREAIAIQALILLERPDDARARADRFRRTFPGSALQPAIDEGLGQ